jgi:hypothetical protein
MEGEYRHRKSRTLHDLYLRLGEQANAASSD